MSQIKFEKSDYNRFSTFVLDEWEVCFFMQWPPWPIPCAFNTLPSVALGPKHEAAVVLDFSLAQGLVA